MNKELLKRYDFYFGNNTSNKLLESRKYNSNQYIRINLSRNSISEIKDFLLKNRVKFSNTFISNAFKVEKSFFNLSSAPESISGKYYLQDLASQIPVCLIDFEKLKNKDKVLILDMAASPGSKTTQLCDLLEFNKINYEIIALEPEKKRVLKLINNIQKQGFRNVSALNSTGESFKFDKKFDIILLDAPCSGNLVGDKDWLDKRDLKGIIDKATLQKKLLENASKLLKDDGILIYSTCSLEVEENELNVLYAEEKLGLKSVRQSVLKFPFETDSRKLIGDKKLVEKIKNLNCVRVMPYLSQTQGFFACVFIKK